MSMFNRVYPDNAPGAEITIAARTNENCDNCLIRRLKNIKKSILVIIGLPIGYLWIPCSCCFRNPLGNSTGFPMENIKEPETYDEKMGENLLIAVNGGIGVLTCCCCCFGCCGKYSPEEI